MSVAFRREGDDEHLEPKFELPLPPGPNLVTEQGLALIRRRIADLEAELASATEESAATAIRRILRYWHTREVTAQLADIPPGDRVAFGTTVTIALNGRQRAITIVGHDEAEPARGLLVSNAPLCRALMGTEVGDLVDYAGMDDAIEVLAIAVRRA